MTSLTLQMTATGSSLPTAWLAPPPGLLTTQKIKVTPVPLAISATIALFIGALVMLLFSRKQKDVYLPDKPAEIPHHEEPKAPADENLLHISSPVEVRVPSTVQRTLSQSKSPMYQAPYRVPVPPPTFPRTHQPQTRVRDWRPSGQKLDAMLGVDARDWQHDGHTLPGRTSHATPGGPRRAYDMESDSDSTLKDDEKNSAYVPFNASEFDFEPEKSAHGGLDSSHISEGDTSVDSVEEYGKRQRRFARKFQLGGPY